MEDYYRACETGDPETIQQAWLALPSELQAEPTLVLLLACLERQPTAVQDSISREGIDLAGDQARTAFRMVCERGDLPLLRYLVEQGVDYGRDLRWCLADACQKGSLASVEYLLTLGVEERIVLHCHQEYPICRPIIRRYLQERRVKRAR